MAEYTGDLAKVFERIIFERNLHAKKVNKVAVPGSGNETSKNLTANSKEIYELTSLYPTFTGSPAPY